jgi:hypothetical protein
MFISDIAMKNGEYLSKYEYFRLLKISFGFISICGPSVWWCGFYRTNGQFGIYRFVNGRLCYYTNGLISSVRLQTDMIENFLPDVNVGGWKSLYNNSNFPVSTFIQRKDGARFPTDSIWKENLYQYSTNYKVNQS